MPGSNRVLMFSEYVPTRTLSGSRTRLAAIAEYFRERGYEIHLVVVQTNATELSPPAEVGNLVERVSRLSLSDFPEFQVRFATKYLLGKNSRAPAGGFVAGAWSKLKRLWKAPALGSTQRLSDGIQRLVMQERPDVVFIDHTWLGSLFVDLIPQHDCLWVIDTHDCLHLRDRSLLAAGMPAESGLSRTDEAALLASFDVILAIQEQERLEFQAMLPGKQVIMLSHCQTLAPQPCVRPAIGFVGSCCEQNVRGLEDFLFLAWPEIRERCRTATVEIAGNVGAAEGIRNLAKADKRIRLLGVVDELASIYRGPAAMICPLWIGSGLKIKLVEALAFGKATVATPVAVQGCEAGIGNAFVLAKGPRDFIEPVIDLLSHPERRARLEQGAVKFAQEHFSPARAWADLDAALAQLREDENPAPSVFLPISSEARKLPNKLSDVRPTIPKILHQTWKGPHVPFEFLGFVDSWRRLHPDWEYRLWTDADNRRFIADHYPEFLTQFDAYPQPIQRADAVRYFLLYHFGGLYVDLDFRACRPIDPLLAGQSCVLGLEPDEHAALHRRERIVGNAFMASAPRHPFFETVMRRLPEFRHHTTALDSTGPFMLSQVMDDFEAPETVRLTPSAQLYPLTLEQADQYRATGHSEVDLSAAYAIHFHHGTWWRAPAEEAA